MKARLFKLLFFLPIFLLLLTPFSIGADRYWIAAAPGNFNVNANWSLTSGGAGGASFPAAGDVAIFDGGGLGNCTITAAITQTTGGFQINAAYTGTITVNPAINVVYGTAHFTQSGGTFTCGTGTFNSAAGAANFILNGGTFNRAAGNSTSAAGSITITGGTYNGAGGTTTLTAGAFTFNAGTYNGAAGNVTITNGAFSQTGGIFNCPTGTITFSNSFTKTAGTFNHNNGTVLFSKNATVAINSDVTLVFNNLTFNGTGAATDYNFASSDIAEINGTLLFAGASRMRIRNAPLHAKGNITVTNTYNLANTHTGTTLLINGTGNQTFTGPGTINLGRLPAVTINKTAGTLSLSGIITIEGNYTYTAGTIDYTSFANTVCFSGLGATQNLTGSHSLGNVNFFGSGGNIYSLNGGMILTVDGTLTFSGAGQFRLALGTIHSKGNISITNTFNGANLHTGNLIINGIPDQTITSSVAIGRGRLPNITINKTAGNLLLAGNISTEGNWTFIDGTVDPQTSSVYIHETKNIDGEGTSTMNFYNLIFADGLDKTLTGDVGVLNNLDIATAWFYLNGNTMFIRNSATNALSYSGGGIISENTGNNSKLSWDINTTNGAHIIPFINSSGDEITFTFDLTAGDAGNVTVSTYPTAANNTPFPVTPQLVTNVDAAGNIDNSLNTVNRFWQIDETGPDPTATLTFQYGEGEWDGGVEPTYNAQRYDEVTDIWQPALPGQTVNTVINTVVVPDVTVFSPWTLSTVATPLAIDMISYNVIPSLKSVDVSWGIFNEANIIGYEIQKTENFNEILTFETVEVGNGLYEISDENPLNGISYYRVVAQMINGEEEYFEWKKATFTNEEFSVFNVYPNPIGGGQTLYIESKESDVNFVQLNDLTGKIMYTSEVASQGNILQITLPENISQGCYILTVNDRKTRLVIR